MVKAIMREQKANQKPRYKFSYELLSAYIPKDLLDSQAEEFMIGALKYYTSRRRKGKQSVSAGMDTPVTA